MAQNENGVWEIGNLDHLYEFARMIETDDSPEGVYRNASYALTADIVVNEGDVSGCNGVKNPLWSDWEPIGRQYWYKDEAGKNQYPELYFGGTFDGQGHTISGLYCNYKGVSVLDYLADIQNVYYIRSIGFFEELMIDAVVCNLGIVNSYFHAPSTYQDIFPNAGALAGRTICAIIDGPVVVNCYSDSTVIGEGPYIGGLIGRSEGGYNYNSFSVGHVTRLFANYRHRENDPFSLRKAGGSFALGSPPSWLDLDDELATHNVYYLSDVYMDDAVTQQYYQHYGYGRTELSFASGEVAYGLSQDFTIKGVTYSGDIWGQNIGTDKYPVFGGPKVHKITSDCTEYSNTENGTSEHNFIDDICTYCGILQPNADGVYEIATAEQLYSFAHMVNTKNDRYGNANAKLTANIDLNEGDVAGHDPKTKAYFKQFGSIGTVASPFKGTFDGQGHTIIGMYSENFHMRATDSSTRLNIFVMGLFGVIDGATISNLGVVNSYVESVMYHLYAAGLCGKNIGGTIENCYYIGNVVDDYIYDDNRVAGIVYENKGTVQNCYTNGNICAVNDGGTISNSISIDKKFGDGIVAKTNKNGGNINNCYYVGDSGVGANEDTATAVVYPATEAQIENGYVAYQLLQSGATSWGQTIGTDKHPVLGGPAVYESTCGGTTYYSNSQQTASESHNYVNGICDKCGQHQFPNQNTENENDTGEGNTPPPEPDPVTPCPDGTHTYANGFCTVCDSYEEPVLTTDKYDLDGDGVMDEVYEIANAGNLYWFRDCYNAEPTAYRSKNVVLTNDIIVNEGDVAGCNGENKGNWRTWSSIGRNLSQGTENDYFDGIFDGQNHEISGLFAVDNDGFRSLINTVAENGVIRNLGIVNSYYGYTTGTAHLTAVFAITNLGLIENCYNKGNGYAIMYQFGGIAYKNRGGTIRNCYNDSDYYGVDPGGYGQYAIAGICVDNNNNSVIENCYNSGNITLIDSWEANASGIAFFNVGDPGSTPGIIRNCYNTGDITVLGKYNSGTAAGLVRTSKGILTDSYNLGNIYSEYTACGICREVTGQNPERVTQNCYNKGIVFLRKPDGRATGIALETYNSEGNVKTSVERVVNCYNVGYVSAKRSTTVEPMFYGLFTKDSKNFSEETYREYLINCYYLSYGNENPNSDKFGATDVEVFTSGEINYLITGRVTIDGSTITAKNETLSGAVLAVASYDNDGRLVDIKTVDVPAGTEVSKTIDELSINTQNVATIKAMLWESLSTIKPLVPIAEKIFGNQISE